jgi:hypothetical protein
MADSAPEPVARYTDAKGQPVIRYVVRIVRGLSDGHGSSFYPFTAETTIAVVTSLGEHKAPVLAGAQHAKLYPRAPLPTKSIWLRELDYDLQPDDVCDYWGGFD